MFLEIIMYRKVFKEVELVTVRNFLSAISFQYQHKISRSYPVSR